MDLLRVTASSAAADAGCVHVAFFRAGQPLLMRTPEPAAMPVGTVYINGKFTRQLLSGVQRVAARLLAELDEQIPAGHASWVLLCPAGGKTPTLKKIEVRPVGPASLNLHVWEQFFLPWAARDGFLLSLIGSAPWFGGRLACMIHDAAVFDHPHSYTPAFAAWYRHQFRRTARRAPLLLTVSDFSRDRLAHHLGRSRQSIRVVPNGSDHLQSVTADTGVLRDLGLEGRPYFLAVASTNPAKNLARVEDAFLQLAERHDVHLIVTGGGNPKVYAQRTSMAGHPRLLRIGVTDDAALRALYDSAVALVFPSLYEGFGLPMVEAMSSGCPVITSELEPMIQVCGNAAQYVVATDTQAIGAAMEGLLLDPEQRKRLRAAGLERAGQFTWSAAAARLLGAITGADLPANGLKAPGA